jgi:tetratricopeptide (TPR) repeat protein
LWTRRIADGDWLGQGVFYQAPRAWRCSGGRNRRSRPGDLSAGELPGRPDNNLGWTLASQGRIAEAIPHFERALALNPGDENATENLERARHAQRH